MATTATVYIRPVRTEYSIDHEGVYWTTKRDDEIVGLTVDWSDALASGETISSVAYVDSGVTTSGKSATTTTTTCAVAGSGETEITITTSDSRVLQRVFRWVTPDGSVSSDYR